MRSLSQQVCGAEDFALTGFGGVQITEGFKPQYCTPGHRRQLRGGDLIKKQDATHKFRHWQPQSQCQHQGIHIYTLLVRRSRRNVNIVETKLNFYPRAPMKSIASQVFIHCLLVTKLRSFWIEIHLDPGTIGSPLSLLLHDGLFFV